MPWERTRDNRHKLKKEDPSENEEELIYCENYRALDQVVQRSCGVSCYRDIQGPPGHCPAQPALAEPDSAGDWTK